RGTGTPGRGRRRVRPGDGEGRRGRILPGERTVPPRDLPRQRQFLPGGRSLSPAQAPAAVPAAAASRARTAEAVDAGASRRPESLACGRRGSGRAHAAPPYLHTGRKPEGSDGQFREIPPRATTGKEGQDRPRVTAFAARDRGGAIGGAGLPPTYYSVFSRLTGRRHDVSIRATDDGPEAKNGCPRGKPTKPSRRWEEYACPSRNPPRYRFSRSATCR